MSSLPGLLSLQGLAGEWLLKHQKTSSPGIFNVVQSSASPMQCKHWLWMVKMTNLSGSCIAVLPEPLEVQLPDSLIADVVGSLSFHQQGYLEPPPVTG
jgi:hypothetical protein